MNRKLFTIACILLMCATALGARAGVKFAIPGCKFTVNRYDNRSKKEATGSVELNFRQSKAGKYLDVDFRGNGIENGATLGLEYDNKVRWSKDRDYFATRLAMDNPELNLESIYQIKQTNNDSGLNLFIHIFKLKNGKQEVKFTMYYEDYKKGANSALWQITGNCELTPAQVKSLKTYLDQKVLPYFGTHYTD